VDGGTAGAGGAVALRFLAGCYEGGALPLRPGRDLSIGRAAGSDLQLDEELTSRRHARISWEGEVPVVEDLGSTNGTFVNGERVRRRRLVEGDRLLIGGNILKVVAAARPSPLTTTLAAAGPLEADRTMSEGLPRRSSAMHGHIEEVGLPDLLQLLGTSRKTGMLRVQSGDLVGAVHLAGGRVIRCRLDGRPDLGPHEVMLALVQWPSGTFDLLPAPAEAPPGPAIDEPVEGMLMEALRRLDEQRRR